MTDIGLLCKACIRYNTSFVERVVVRRCWCSPILPTYGMLKRGFQGLAKSPPMNTINDHILDLYMIHCFCEHKIGSEFSPKMKNVKHEI